MDQRRLLLDIGRRGLLGGGAMAAAGLFSLGSGLGSRPAAAAEGDDVPSLDGKTIAISIVGTDHHWDLEAYKAQIAEVERLGGTAVGLDAGRNDTKLVAQLQTVIGQKPDAVVQTLGTLSVVDPWLKKIADAGIPLFTVDLPSTNSINNTTSDNFMIGSSLALQLVSDIGGKGNVVVFNGFYGRAGLRDPLRPAQGRAEILPGSEDPGAGTARRDPEHGAGRLHPDHRGPEQVPGEGLGRRGLVGLGRAAARRHPGDRRGRSRRGAHLRRGRRHRKWSSWSRIRLPAAAVAAQQPAEIGRASIPERRPPPGRREGPGLHQFLPSVLVTKANAAEAQKQLGQG